MGYTIQGQAVDLSEEPREVEGQLYVPLTEVAQRLGGQRGRRPARSAGASPPPNRPRKLRARGTPDQSERRQTTVERHPALPRRRSRLTAWGLALNLGGSALALGGRPADAQAPPRRG